MFLQSSCEHYTRTDKLRGPKARNSIQPRKNGAEMAVKACFCHLLHVRIEKFPTFAQVAKIKETRDSPNGLGHTGNGAFY